MSDPAFNSRTARHDMPFLFAGQAQKEGHVNEAIARIDALLHMAIEGEISTAPTAPQDGQTWLIGTAPGGEWAGHAGQLAARVSGNWLYFTPCDGMRVLDRTNGQERRYSAGWHTATRPAPPTGGTTIDPEARATINALLASLTTAGILPPA